MARHGLPQWRSFSSLSLLTGAVAYTALSHGGDALPTTSIALVVVGIAGVLSFRLSSSSNSRRTIDGLIDACALLLPAYFVIQLLPLPFEIVSLISPRRAELTAALGSVSDIPRFVPLSISPEGTWRHLIRVAGFSLVFVSVRRIAGRGSLQPWALAAPLIAIGTLEAVSGLAVDFEPGKALSGTFYSKNHFGNILALTIPLAVVAALALAPRSGRWQLKRALAAAALLSAAVAMFTAVMLSLSKMAVLATLGSLSVIAVLGIPAQRARTRVAVAAGAFLLGTLALIFLIPGQLVDDFSSVVSADPTDGRWPIWKDTLRLIADYWLVGSGGGTFYPAILRYQTYGLPFAWTSAHNDYLQWLAEGGIAGFSIQAALLIGALGLAIRRLRHSADRPSLFLTIACIGSLTAGLIHNVAEFNSYVLCNALVLAWIAALATVPLRSARSPSRAQSAHSVAWTDLAVSALALLTVLYAGTRLMVLRKSERNPVAQGSLCALGFCNSHQALVRLDRDYGDSAIPERDLLPLLRRSPADPSNWQALGNTYLHSKRVDKARACFSRAQMLAPRNPGTLHDAGRFHMTIGETVDGVRLVAQSLESDPQRTDRAFSEYTAHNVPNEQVLQHGLPSVNAVWRSYLRWQMQRTLAVDAQLTWRSMIERGLLDAPLAAEYIDFLILQGSPHEAWQTWTQYARSLPGSSQETSLSNPGFETDPAPTRFDWRIGKVVGLTAGFDAEVKKSGGRALRIVFDGSANPSDLGVRQVVWLDGGKYRLRAWVKTENVSTDQGVAFTVASEGAPKLLNVTTSNLLGTNDWTLVEQEFDAPPAGGLVRVSLTRQHSFRFDNLVRGTVWVDDVSLTPVPPA